MKVTNDPREDDSTDFLPKAAAADGWLPAWQGHVRSKKPTDGDSWAWFEGAGV